MGRFKGDARIVSKEKGEIERIPFFRSIAEWGNCIFQCDKCNKERIFGYGIPDNKHPLLKCTACGRNTIHSFLRMHQGRAENTYA